MEINKKELRSKMRQIRNQLTSDEMKVNSQRIFDKILNHTFYKQAACIYSYASFRNEVDTLNFHKRVLKDGKRLALPKILSDEHMEFYIVSNLNQLVQSPMGILEPDESCEIIKSFDGHSMMIVPGLAFDHHFGRLGYGRGYYDRYLDNISTKMIRCGIAYQCQIVTQVPTTPFDQLMDLIVTEDEWIERVDAK